MQYKEHRLQQNIYYTVPEKTSTFLFFEQLCQKLTDLNDFGTLNPEKILRKILPVSCSHFTYYNISHTYFWLITLSQKKTNYIPLADPTWKCHHTNLWIAKLFHLTEGLLRFSNVGGSEESQLWAVIDDTDQSHGTPRCADIHNMSQQAAAESRNMSVSIHALLR